MKASSWWHILIPVCALIGHSGFAEEGMQHSGNFTPQVRASSSHSEISHSEPTFILNESTRRPGDHQETGGVFSVSSLRIRALARSGSLRSPGSRGRVREEGRPTKDVTTPPSKTPSPAPSAQGVQTSQVTVQDLTSLNHDELAKKLSSLSLEQLTQLGQQISNTLKSSSSLSASDAARQLQLLRNIREQVVSLEKASNLVTELQKTAPGGRDEAIQKALSTDPAFRDLYAQMKNTGAADFAKRVGITGPEDEVTHLLKSIVDLSDDLLKSQGITHRDGDFDLSGVKSFDPSDERARAAFNLVDTGLGDQLAREDRRSIKVGDQYFPPPSPNGGNIKALSEKEYQDYQNQVRQSLDTLSPEKLSSLSIRELTRVKNQITENLESSPPPSSLAERDKRVALLAQVSQRISTLERVSELYRKLQEVPADQREAAVRQEFSQNPKGFKELYTELKATGGERGFAARAGISEPKNEDGFISESVIDYPDTLLKKVGITPRSAGQGYDFSGISGFGAVKDKSGFLSTRDQEVKAALNWLKDGLGDQLAQTDRHKDFKIDGQYFLAPSQKDGRVDILDEGKYKSLQVAVKQFQEELSRGSIDPATLKSSELKDELDRRFPGLYVKIADPNRRGFVVVGNQIFLPPDGNGKIQIISQNAFQEQVKRYLGLFDREKDGAAQFLNDRDGITATLKRFYGFTEGKIRDSYGEDQTINGKNRSELKLDGYQLGMSAAINKLSELGVDKDVLKRLYNTQQALNLKEGEMISQTKRDLVAVPAVAALAALTAPATAPLIVSGAGIGFGLSGTRQAVQIYIDGTRKDFDANELAGSMLSGAVLGPVGKVPVARELLGLAGAGTALKSSVDEFNQKNVGTGLVDLATFGLTAYGTGKGLKNTFGGRKTTGIMEQTATETSPPPPGEPSIPSRTIGSTTSAPGEAPPLLAAEKILGGGGVSSVLETSRAPVSENPSLPTKVTGNTSTIASEPVTNRAATSAASDVRQINSSPASPAGSSMEADPFPAKVAQTGDVVPSVSNLRATADSKVTVKSTSIANPVTEKQALPETKNLVGSENVPNVPIKESKGNVKVGQEAKEVLEADLKKNGGSFTGGGNSAGHEFAKTPEQLVRDPGDYYNVMGNIMNAAKGYGELAREDFESGIAPEPSDIASAKQAFEKAEILLREARKQGLSFGATQEDGIRRFEKSHREFIEFLASLGN